MYRDEELRRALGAEEYRMQSQRIREEREALKKAERRELRQGISTAIAYVMVVVWIVAVSALDAAPFQLYISAFASPAARFKNIKNNIISHHPYSNPSSHECPQQT